jgi:mannose-1-phosphate guanylyltransferase
MTIVSKERNMVTVMLLAAGKGTRMMPYTQVHPKPLLPILDKPIAEWIMLHLKAQGVRDFVVNLSYLPAVFAAHFADGKQLGVNISYSLEGELDAQGQWCGTALGSAGGMLKAEQAHGCFGQDFVVMCADALTDLQLEPLLAFHRAHGGLVTVVSKSVAQHEVCNYGVIVADANGKIQQFQEKPALADALSTQVSTGIYVFSPQVLQFIPQAALTTGYDIAADLFVQLLGQGHNLYHYPLQGEWIDFGVAADFWQVNRKALLRQIDMLEALYSAGLADDGCLQSGVFMGRNAVLHPECKVQAPCYIGHNVQAPLLQAISNAWLQPLPTMPIPSNIADRVLYQQLDVPIAN